MLFVLLFISFDTISIAQVRTTTSQKTGAKPVTRILFLVDASASMLNPWEERNKMDAAQQIISEFVDSLKFKNDVQVALRIYGHQSINSANDCGDTKLEVGFASGNAVAIKVALGKIRPKGITPLAFSLEKAASDFPVDASAKNIVVLVTDGEESCGGDPCAVSLKMQQKNIYLKPFVIGLNLDPAKKSAMECIGNYYNADKPSALREIMKTVIDRILSSATVTVNLLDADGRPLETDVNMSFIDNGSGEVKYNFYHTLNYRGEPDTLQLDPVLNYDLTIHTTPSIEREQLHFTARKNEVLNIPASQGFLKVELTGSLINNNLNSKIKCLVRREGSTETIAVMDMNTNLKLLSGNYNLEVLTIPRMQISQVSIKQSSTTTVKIEVPGVLNLVKTFPGYGAIFIDEDGRLAKIYGLNENLANELVGLQAGEYTLVFRGKSSKKTTDSITRKFRIKSGESLQLKL